MKCEGDREACGQWCREGREGDQIYLKTFACLVLCTGEPSAPNECGCVLEPALADRQSHRQSKDISKAIRLIYYQSCLKCFASLLHIHTYIHTAPYAHCTHVPLCACAIVSQSRRRKPSTWSDTTSSSLRAVVNSVGARCVLTCARAGLSSRGNQAGGSVYRGVNVYANVKGVEASKDRPDVRESEKKNEKLLERQSVAVTEVRMVPICETPKDVGQVR